MLKPEIRSFFKDKFPHQMPGFLCSTWWVNLLVSGVSKGPEITGKTWVGDGVGGVRVRTRACSLMRRGKLAFLGSQQIPDPPKTVKGQCLLRFAIIFSLGFKYPGNFKHPQSALLNSKEPLLSYPLFPSLSPMFWFVRVPTAFLELCFIWFSLSQGSLSSQTSN